MAKVKTRAAAGSKTKTAAAKQAKGNGGQKRAASREQDRKLVGEIKELRSGDKPKTHAEIAKKLGIQVTKALFLDCVGQVSKAKQVKNLTPAQVKSFRNDDGLAWHVISARTFAAGDDHFVSVGKIKAMYKEATGKTASGRLPAAKKGSSRGR